ncbi:MAG: hypothetical protein J6L91_04980 [Clostridia bacterium]|nr:hypothetical protein [Clostridia bacterium]
MVRGLYGSEIKESRVVGYCKLHKVSLTATTLRRHECLRKQCNALSKNEEHSYWVQRARLKEKRLQNKNGKLG